MADAQLNSSRILEVSMGFFTAKTLLSAVELGLFTELAHDALTGREIGTRLRLHERAIYDFLDGLVAMGFLERDGEGPSARYRNGDEAAAFLDRNQPTYIGGLLEMFNSRLYGFWGDLTTALRTGKPQNELKHTGSSMFAEVYSDEARLEQFLYAMAGISLDSANALADRFDFAKYTSVCDVGGATGQVSMTLAERHPHLHCTSFDLPVVAPIAEKALAAAGLTDRVTITSGDFFTDQLPRADVVVMGRILHDWNLEQKMHLIRAAYDALPAGGALVVIESLIDDARRTNTVGLMMSLNMLIEFGDAFDYTGADFTGWCREVGFDSVEILPLTPAMSAAIAYK
ncbi:methyltransferase [Mycolicibacterium arseniciresistens]|uniref:Methyltransferase n=1 Tax=Mycolicibacterium arseniciresistens TaxID=3062257 RepID=A0ABT8UHI0_9MYCO|nr:methyltransferase [Mycolicibacterium arseniciresistens]MDO3637248.1 methyltransferase [Mycolicibacterium arseniciresistens]